MFQRLALTIDCDMSDWQEKLKNWFYLDAGLTDFVWRGMGLSGIPVSFMVWEWSHGGSGPYIAPAWRIGPNLLYLPVLPQMVETVLLVFFWLACLAMFFRVLGRFPVLYAFLFFCFFASRDWNAMGPHFVPIQICTLFSLLFYQPGKSLTRRLIQLNFGIIYILSAIQKLAFPDFVRGFSFQAQFSDGWIFNWATKGTASYLASAVPDWGWALFAYATILGEASLAVCLFLPRTKKVAIWCAFIFHYIIGIFFDTPLQIFSLVTCIALLAFVDAQSMPIGLPNPEQKPIEEANKIKVNPIQVGLAAVYLAFIALFPLRIYFWEGRPVAEMDFLDRTPWTFGLYIMRNEPKGVTVSYQVADGTWHGLDQKIMDTGRVPFVESDSEMYAFANWIFQRYPDAKSLFIIARISINKRWGIEKKLIQTRGLPANIGVQVMHFPPH